MSDHDDDTDTHDVAVPHNPFARAAAGHLSAGTVAIESERAIAEAQGKLIIAKRFPRDQANAFARVMDSCRRPSLAAVASYAFPRSGQTVSGPSIRLAEEMARNWENLDYGLRELSRKPGESEMEAYAWDLETNVMTSQKFTVKHIRDKRGGNQMLTDERDIYEATANAGARRLRARILAILPPDLVDAAVEQCKKTMAGANTKPLSDQIFEATQAFVRFNVTAEMLATRLGHPLDDTTPDELSELRGIFASLKDGMTKVGDWFGASAKGAPDAQERPASKLDALTQAATQTAAADPPKTTETVADKTTATADASEDPIEKDVVWVIEQIEACDSEHALRQFLSNTATKAKAKKFSEAHRRRVEIAELAAREGWKKPAGLTAASSGPPDDEVPFNTGD